MRSLAAADFSPRIGEVFAAASGAGQVELTLDEIAQHGVGSREGGSFSLFFSGPASQPLGQGTRELAARDFAESIFLVPVALKDGRFRYEAVFN